MPRRIKKKNGFVEFRFQPAFLSSHGLPDIGYPVPAESLDAILEAGGEFSPASLLYWLQIQSEHLADSWQEKEEGMLALARQLAQPDDRETGTVQGDEWWLELGRVDLKQEIVTIQRGDILISALRPRSDFRLRAAVFRPLDANAIRCLLRISRNPAADGTVGRCRNNWHYAIESVGSGTSSYYAYRAGESYRSYWDHGLGLNSDGSVDERFAAQLEKVPLMPSLIAVQLGVYYRLCPDLTL